LQSVPSVPKKRVEDVANFAERVDETHDLVVEEVAEKAEES